MSNFLLDLNVNQLNSINYYPFGSPMPERSFSSPSYRYGYQGSEKDDEVKGEGNSYTTFYRMLDPRLGRWFSVDPKIAKQPYQTSYCSMDNNPIMLNDIYGDIVRHKSKKDKQNTTLGRIFNKDFRQNYRVLKKSEEIYVIQGEKSEKNTSNGEGITTFNGVNKDGEAPIYIKYQYGKFKSKSGTSRFGVLYHETTHGVQFEEGRGGFQRPMFLSPGEEDKWYAFNVDLGDEVEGFNAGWKKGKKFYNSHNPYGKNRDITDAGFYNTLSVEDKMLYLSQFVGYKDLPKFELVNKTKVRILTSTNFMRPYNPSAKNQHKGVFYNSINNEVLTTPINTIGIDEPIDDLIEIENSNNNFPQW